MADNVAITAGSGTTIAADDIGGVLHQRVKATWGPDGTANDTDVASGKPMPVQLRVSDGTAFAFNSGAASAGTQRVVSATDDPIVTAINTGVASAIPAGEAHLGEVGGNTVVTSITLSTDTSAYASGDLIADTQQINGFFRKTDGTGVVQSITIIDEDAQGVALYVAFMSTSTTWGTENSAPSISDANLTAGLLGFVAVATSDYVTVSGTKIACIKNIGLPVKAVSGTDDIYIAVLNGTGTPTFTASGLEMRIGALLD